MAPATEVGDTLKMGRLALVVSIVAATAAPASADLLKLYAEAHGGGMYGAGTSGAQKDHSFFHESPHFAYGVLVGAQLLFATAQIQHHQYTLTDGARLTTWTQFGLGVHTVVDTGTEKEQKAHQGGYYEFGGGVWFGLGTGQQVRPPLDNAQLSDKGFLVEGRVGFGRHLSSVFDVGVTVPVSYGYFFKQNCGVDCAANDTGTHYRGWQAEALVVLRGTLHLL